MLWKIIPAHIYVTAIVLSWGIVASLQSIVTSFAGLLVLRTLLGIGEAGSVNLSYNFPLSHLAKFMIAIHKIIYVPQHLY